MDSCTCVYKPLLVVVVCCVNTFSARAGGFCVGIRMCTSFTTYLSLVKEEPHPPRLLPCSLYIPPDCCYAACTSPQTAAMQPVHPPDCYHAACTSPRLLPCSLYIRRLQAACVMLHITCTCLMPIRMSNATTPLGPIF